jgi:hypothetical protein
MLASTGQLGTLLKLTVPDDDPYALMMLAQASNAVRDEARQQSWVRKVEPTDVLATGQVEAPETAQDITLWVAYRAYTNPGNLARRTTGPLSETWFENGVYGLELTDDEKRRLGKLTGSTGGGIWAQPISVATPENEKVYVPVGFQTATGGFYIADGDQFPYGSP